jgi:hypothetical protein
MPHRPLLAPVLADEQTLVQEEVTGEFAIEFGCIGVVAEPRAWLRESYPSS